MPTCEDKVPESPDAYLLSLFKQCRDGAELLKQGKKPEGRVHQMAKICSAIAEYWEDGQNMSTSASENGWPLIRCKSAYARIPRFCRIISA